MTRHLRYWLFLAALAIGLPLAWWGAWEAWVAMLHWLGACT